jgi:hypothetical protein
MMIMKEPAMIKSFVNLTIEILNYAMEIFPLQQYAQQLTAEQASLLNPATTSSMPDDLKYHYNILNVNYDTISWPNMNDAYLLTLFKTMSSLVINQELLQYYMSLSYVMQLRFQCKLRGMKPSLLLNGNEEFQALQRIVLLTSPLSHSINSTPMQNTQNPTFTQNLGILSLADSFAEKSLFARHSLSNEQLSNEYIHIRTEFLELSFRRLIREERPLILYALGSVWSYPVDLLRLLHIQALLEFGDADNEIEEMIPQVIIIIINNNHNISFGLI